MNIKQFSLAALILLALPITACAEKAEKPNIIFILVDDQRNDSLGIEGHPHLKTPHIDKLATEGVRFKNSFVNTSICMASRATSFTGLTQTGHSWRPGDPEGSVPVSPKILNESVPVKLRETGYHTGYYGKNHVSFEEGLNPAFDRMFDDWEIISRNPYFKDMPDGSKRHCDEIMGDRSIDFISSRPTEKPFMLYMSFNISHAEDNDHRPGIGHFPWPKEEDGLYEDITPNRPRLDDPKYFDAAPELVRKSLNHTRYAWRWDTPEKYTTNMRALYRMLTGMDRIIGRVQAELEKQGVADNTVIVYTADNGYYMGDRGFAGKWSHYEQSLRVPLIVYDPRALQQRRNKVLPEMVSNVDIPSTMLEIAGIDIPSSYQGHSLVPLLKGHTPDDWPTYVYCEHHQLRDLIPAWMGIRDQRYVYARYNRVDPAVEVLHDLETDPDQLVNLAANPEYARILENLSKLADQKKAEYTVPEVKATLKEMALKAKAKKESE